MGHVMRRRLARTLLALVFTMWAGAVFAAKTLEFTRVAPVNTSQFTYG